MRIKGIARILGITILAAMIVAFTVPTVFASDDNISFKFRIGILQTNGQDPNGRFRQTTNPQNPWKVKLTSHSQGEGSYAIFWLEGADNSNVSPDRTVRLGKPAVYTTAYASANKRTVYLTGENLNYVAAAYTVGGLWDEETA